MAERSNKLFLDNKELTEGFFEDIRLLGIMAPIKDYQFCWHLNNNIGLDFRINEIEIKLIKRKGITFSLFMNTKYQLVHWSIIFTITSLTENIYCPNSNILIFMADERG